MSEQDKNYIFTEEAKKLMEDMNTRVTDKSLSVNTTKRSNNTDLAATNANLNEQMRSTEVYLRELNIPK